MQEQLPSQPAPTVRCARCERPLPPGSPTLVCAACSDEERATALAGQRDVRRPAWTSTVLAAAACVATVVALTAWGPYVVQGPHRSTAPATTTTTQPPTPRFTDVEHHVETDCVGLCRAYATVRNDGADGSGSITMTVRSDDGLQDLATCSTSIPYTYSGMSTDVDCLAASQELYSYMIDHPFATLQLALQPTASN